MGLGAASLGGETIALVVHVSQALSTVVQILIAVWLFSHGQPRRGRYVLRVAAVAAALLSVALVYVWLGYVACPQIMADHGMLARVTALSVALLLLVACVRSCSDVSWWTALACAVGAFSIQSLASGANSMVGLVEQLVGVRVGEQSMAGIPLMLANSYLTLIAIYLVCYYAFVRRMASGKIDPSGEKGLLAMIVLVIWMIVVFDVVLRGPEMQGLSLWTQLVLRLLHCAVCGLLLYVEYEMLYVRRLRADAEVTSRLMAERKRQYALSKEAVDAINAKCHDIRHQIWRLSQGSGRVDEGVLQGIANEVNVYDSLFETGNEALDVVLTEKGLLCEKYGIRLTCMADGPALGFMTPADLYALVGSALDDAIAASREVAEGKRSVSLMVRRRARMVSVHVEHRRGERRALTDGCVGQCEFDDGGSVATRTTRQILQRYGGVLATDAEGDVFCLDMMIPVPAVAARQDSAKMPSR